MIKIIERWAIRRIVERTLERIGVLDEKKIQEGLSAASDDTMKAILSFASGREQEAREFCSVRGQTADDLRFNSGKLADAIEFQEELIALVKDARAGKQI